MPQNLYRIFTVDFNKRQAMQERVHCHAGTGAITEVRQLNDLGSKPRSTDQHSLEILPRETQIEYKYKNKSNTNTNTIIKAKQPSYAVSKTLG